MDSLKFWFSLLVISSGLLAIFADDHGDIAALQVKVAKQGKQIESIDEKADRTDTLVGALTKAVDAEQKELKQSSADLNIESAQRMELNVDLAATKEKWNSIAAAVEKTIADDKENATERMDEFETMLHNQITLSSAQYKLIEEKWKNETKRADALEQRLRIEEEKSVEHEKKLKQQEKEAIKIQQNLAYYSKRVDDVFDLLPNATFPNRSSIIHVKLDKLKVQVSQDEENIEKIRADVNEESKKLSDTSSKVLSLGNTVAHVESNLDDLFDKLKNMDAAHDKEHEKFHQMYPDTNGFRYTGRGWSYGDSVSMKNIHLGDCLKLCALKRSRDKRFSGVNYFVYPNGVNICYCVKKAYGYTPNEHAMQFLAD